MKRYSIVGMEHRKAEDFVKNLQAGADATLVREPTNQWDTNAIMVWIDGIHVGYVPKAQNKALAAFIDQAGVPLVSAEVPLVSAIAMDADMEKANPRVIPAKFVRSPNSGYPMVEVSE